jgi:hypothetical protein
VSLSLLQQLAGPVGAAIAALFFVYLFVTGKVHSHGEFLRLLKENNELKKALEDERKVANEAVQTGSVTNRLIGALVEVTSERRREGRQTGLLAMPPPGPRDYPDSDSDAGDAEM